MVGKNIRRIVVGTLSLALLLSVAESTQAAGPGKGGSSNKGSSSGSSHGSPAATSSKSTGGNGSPVSATKAFKFAYGHYFKGHHGHNWSFHRYYASYGFTLYYDTDTTAYYYWCQPDDCYYPVGYCPYGTYSGSE